MNPDLASQNWIDSLNPMPGGVAVASITFSGNQDLTERSVRDALENSQHHPQNVALVLNMPLGNTLASRARSGKEMPRQDNQLRIYLSHLVAEIRMLGSLIGRGQQLTSLYWPAEMTSLLQPAEMTELLYYINRSFSIPHDQREHFVFELTEMPPDDGLIALARGLGFTDIFLSDFNLIYQRPKKDAQAFVRLLRHYGFETIGARMRYRHHEGPDKFDDLVARAIELKIDVMNLAEHPAYDNVQPKFSASWNLREPVQIDRRLIKKLLGSGYKPFGLRSFSAFEPPVQPSPELILGAGLSGMSIINNLFSVNVDQLDQYYSLLDQQLLPFGHGGFIQS